MTRIGFAPLYTPPWPSSRYRVFQLIQPLEEAGYQCSVIEAPERNFRKRLGYVPRLFRLARSVDVLYIQKRTLPGWVLQPLRRINPRLIYDFDDAVYLQAPRVKQLKAMLRTVRAVAAGNEQIAAYARQYNDNVAVIPTVIDTRRYLPAPRPQAGESPVWLGWVGSNPNFGSLAMLQPVFDGLAERFGQQVALRIVGSQPLQMVTQMQVEFVPWSLEKSAANLQAMDIGLMPLQDTPWNTAKCGFKIIQYGAVGIPSVASPVGVNREIIQEEQTGFLAESPQAWLDRLSALIMNKPLRQKMGELARQRVEERYSVASLMPTLVELIRATSAKAPYDSPQEMV